MQVAHLVYDLFDYIYLVLTHILDNSANYVGGDKSISCIEIQLSYFQSIFEAKKTDLLLLLLN